MTVTNPATGFVVPGLGGGNFTFRVDATDGAPDRFALNLTTSSGALYHQVGTMAQQLALWGGSIVQHS